MRFIAVFLLVLGISTNVLAEGFVCAQVIPDCDKEGNLSVDYSDPASPCYYYYSAICLSQKLNEVSKQNENYRKKLKKTRKKLKRAHAQVHNR